MRVVITVVLTLLMLDCQAAFPKKQLKITGQKSLSIQQGGSVTLRLSDLVVEADADLHYPNGFYLEIGDGDNYTVAGTTIFPTPGFNGELRVKVRVTNGNIRSDKFNLKITVKAGGGTINDKPVIVNQANIEILKNRPYALKFADLVVRDSDDPYPVGFTIKVDAGIHYSVSGRTITPALNFVGDLTVKVRVNDGKEDSDPFDLRILVKEIAVDNTPPVITAQANLSVLKGQSIQMKLTDLSVTDPDDVYPTGFTLTVLPGTNYTVSGHTITSTVGFVGMLSVKVKVNDGTSDSNIFEAKINVVEGGTLQIIGQTPITISEDSVATITTEHLKVDDPSNTYPTGFTLELLAGENFTVDGNIVTPKQNFNGDLFVNALLRQGAATSNTFPLLIVVSPVNDAPEFSTFSSDPIFIMQNSVDLPIAQEVSVSDVDSDKLVYAEVSLESENANLILSFMPTTNLRGVYDAANKLLLFIGSASPDEYTTALRSITFSNNNDSSKAAIVAKFRLNDGEALSDSYEKTLTFSQGKLHLDIPNAFTPNNDNANDIWKIEPIDQEVSIKEYLLKVYNRRGQLLFESYSLESFWDGTFKGELLPFDAYFYTIAVTLSDASVTLYKGVVTVMK